MEGKSIIQRVLMDLENVESVNIISSAPLSNEICIET